MRDMGTRRSFRDGPDAAETPLDDGSGDGDGVGVGGDGAAAAAAGVDSGFDSAAAGEASSAATAGSVDGEET